MVILVMVAIGPQATQEHRPHPTRRAHRVRNHHGMSDDFEPTSPSGETDALTLHTP